MNRFVLKFIIKYFNMNIIINFYVQKKESHGPSLPLNALGQPVQLKLCTSSGTISLQRPPPQSVSTHMCMCVCARVHCVCTRALCMQEREGEGERVREGAGQKKLHKPQHHNNSELGLPSLPMHEPTWNAINSPLLSL